MVLAIQDHPYGKVLSLWENQVKLRTGDIASSSKCLSPTQGTPRLCEPTIYDAADTLWLLHKFLEKEYPNGGMVRCTNPAKDDSGESVFARLSEFLCSPPHQRHPFIREVQMLPELAKREGANLKKSDFNKSALDVLRGQSKNSVCKTTRVQNPSGGPKINISCTLIWIKPSAPANTIANPEYYIGNGSSEDADRSEEDDDEHDEIEEEELKISDELQAMSGSITLEMTSRYTFCRKFCQ